MTIAAAKIYRFGDVEVDISRECLRIDGEERHLRQKAFQVLTLLLEKREQVVTKQELFASVWPETAVTDDVLVQCVKEIRRVIGDDPHKSRFIKTVPKSGYRFIGDAQETLNGHSVSAASTTASESTAGRAVQAPPPMPGKRFGSMARIIIVGLGAAVFAVAAFYFAWFSFSQTNSDVRLPAIEGRKSVAVMFFDNQSKSTDFAWLREGLADMLITGLSRSERLTVLSREQLFMLLERYYDENAAISLDAAKDLAARSQAQYFISGSYSHIGSSIRLDARVHETSTGSLIATESLAVDKPEQLLTQIDLLALKLSNRLGSPLGDNPSVAGVMTDNLDAYRFYSLAVEKAQGLHVVEAVNLLEKAIALDPDFAMAQARIGYTYAVSSGDVEKGKPYLQKAFQLGARLTEKDRMNITAWYAIANLDYSAAITSYRAMIERFPLEVEFYGRLARLLRGEDRGDEAVEVLRRGLAIDPESKDLYNALGTLLSGKGKHEEAIAAHERYVALASEESNAYDSLGLSYQASGNYEKAIENYEKAIQLTPTFEIAIVHLANTQFRRGQYDAAIETFRRYTSLAQTDFVLSRGYEGIAYIYVSKGDLEMAERFLKDYEKLSKGPSWIAYSVALKRGQTARAKSIEKPLFERFLGSDRGSRANRRIDLFNRGTVAKGNGSFEEALESFRQALSLPPPTWHWTDFEDCLANAYLEAGRYDEAITEYQRILAANPQYPLAEFYLGKAYLAKGLRDDAAAAYRRFLEVWKNADADIPAVIEAREFLASN